MCVFFFFQAEDGIRDVAVTGFQTCALPISCSRPMASSSAEFISRKPAQIFVSGAPRKTACSWLPVSLSTHSTSTPRSEEHTSELQSRLHLVCRLLLEKKK